MVEAEEVWVVAAWAEWVEWHLLRHLLRHRHRHRHLLPHQLPLRHRPLRRHTVAEWAVVAGWAAVVAACKCRVVIRRGSREMS